MLIKFRARAQLLSARKQYSPKAFALTLLDSEGQGSLTYHRIHLRCASQWFLINRPRYNCLGKPVLKHCQSSDLPPSGCPVFTTSSGQPLICFYPDRISPHWPPFHHWSISSLCAGVHPRSPESESATWLRHLQLVSSSSWLSSCVNLVLLQQGGYAHWENGTFPFSRMWET